MNSNQKEILERVLLMMKYDSSKTLNENISEIKVINEQSYNSDWDGTYVNGTNSIYNGFERPNYIGDKKKTAKNLRVVDIQPVSFEKIMACKTKTKGVFGPVTEEEFKKRCQNLRNFTNSYYVDSNGKMIIQNGLPIDPNTYGGSVGQMFTVWQLVKPTTEFRNKYKDIATVSGSDKLVQNMSLKELSDYISYGFSESSARFGLTKEMKDAIIRFAKKIKSLSTEELINLSYKYPCLFVESNSKQASISTPNKVSKDKLLSQGVQAMIIDFELYKRYDMEYDENPEKFNYQPIRYPNWDNLIKYYGLDFLKDFKASADKVVERFEKGIKGRTQEGYPDYGSRYLNMQGALADMGYMKHYQLMNKITVTFQNALENYNKKNGTSYKMPLECGMSQQEIARREKYNETWSYDNPIKECDLLLSELRKTAYPEINNYSQNETSEKESEEEAKKFLDERIKKEFINIDIDKRTWGYPDENVKGQKVRLGPAVTFMNESQVSKIVDYLLKNCIGQSYGQGIESGSEYYYSKPLLCISVDSYQIPYCLRYNLIKEEENNDTEESEI